MSVDSPSDGFVDELVAAQLVENSARKYFRALQVAATNRQGLVDTMAENQHRLIEPAEAYHAHTLGKGRGREVRYLSFRSNLSRSYFGAVSRVAISVLNLQLVRICNNVFAPALPIARFV